MTATLTLYTFPSATATDGKSWIPAVRFALTSLGGDGSEVRFRSVIDHIEHHPDFPGWDIRRSAVSLTPRLIEPLPWLL